MIPDADDVSAALSAPASIWFGDALAHVASEERGAFAAAWSVGGRRLGRAAVGERWTADEAGRALLLVRHLGTLAATRRRRSCWRSTRRASCAIEWHS